MGIRFSIDGIIDQVPEPNEQELLQSRINNFNNNKQTQFDNLRAYRNQQLFQSDWIVMIDSPIPVGIQSSWKEYRQKLRDLPNHSNAPDRFLISDWPLSPEQQEIPDEVKVFIAEISDPIGIGTTSWVGLGDDGQYLDLMPPPSEPEPEVTPEPKV
jgi:hypothetical protein